MGLERLDYDASVADFFIFTRYFRAPRAPAFWPRSERHVRTRPASTSRRRRNARWRRVDADAPSRAPHRDRARAGIARARDGRDPNDARSRRRRRRDASPRATRDAKTRRAIPSTSNAVTSMARSTRSIDDGAERAREGATATTTTRRRDATSDDDAARGREGERLARAHGVHRRDEPRVRRGARAKILRGRARRDAWSA